MAARPTRIGLGAGTRASHGRRPFKDHAGFGLVPLIPNHYCDLVRSSDYWTTSAQLMAILALAIVVEGRSLTSRWSVKTPTAMKVIQIATLASPLVVFALAIPHCLAVLRGRDPIAWADELIEFTISLSLAALVLNPAVDFMVRTFSRQLSRVMVRGYFASYRLKLTVIRIQMLRVGIPATRGTRRIEHKLRRKSRELAAIRVQLLEYPPHPARDEAIARLDEARRLLVEQLVTNGQVRQRYRELKNKYNNARAHVKSGVPVEILDEISKALEEAIIANGLLLPEPESGQSTTKGDDGAPNDTQTDGQSRNGTGAEATSVAHATEDHQPADEAQPRALHHQR